MSEESLLREIASADPRLAKSLRKGGGGHVAHVANVLRSTPPRQRRAAASRMRRQMTRPSTGAGRPNTGRGVTFHFQLSEAHSAERGASHQKYIEREGACAASFGTVGDTIEERCDAWREIDARSIARTGWVECEEWASTKEKETFRHATGERKRFSTKDYDEYAEVMSQVRDANAGRVPEHVRTHAPRHSIVQRRLIAELAHELPIERQKIALERWCTKNLGRRAVQWHAVIHAPEGKNDPRNWHAHIVFTTVNLDRMRNDGKLPQQGQFVRILNGNGKRKKKGAAELVRRMRSSWAEEQNRELENEGCEKRYDPRSYRAAGIDREPGEHLGPARAALERTEDGALYWSQDRSGGDQTPTTSPNGPRMTKTRTEAGKRNSRRGASKNSRGRSAKRSRAGRIWRSENRCGPDRHAKRS